MLFLQIHQFFFRNVKSATNPVHWNFITVILSLIWIFFYISKCLLNFLNIWNSVVKTVWMSFSVNIFVSFESVSSDWLFSFFFFLAVPISIWKFPGFELVPQQRLEPLQWQYQVPNPLHHKGTPIFLFMYYVILLLWWLVISDLMPELPSSLKQVIKLSNTRSRTTW